MSGINGERFWVGGFLWWIQRFLMEGFFSRMGRVIFGAWV